METTKYENMYLEFDVTADFREMERILKQNQSKIQFIKSESLIFQAQDEQINKCKMFNNDLKLWLMSSGDTYYVFLNCGLKRYDSFSANLGPNDEVKYDISYPIFEIFDTEKEAIAFYEKIKLLLNKVRITESICQKFNAKYISDSSYEVYKDGRNVGFFERTIYSFNKSQKFIIFLQKINSNYKDYYIIVNRKVKIAFDSIEERDACWKYITKFYENFEENKICGISTQLFLTDFLSELVQMSDTVREFQKKEGKVSWLRCEFNGYDIFFRLISRNGRYWGENFEFKIIKFENFEMVYDVQRSEIKCLKSILQEIFPKEEFIQKYFSC